MSRFYPIIDYDFSGPLGPGLARELAASGCGMLQLRAKGATSAQFFSFSQQVLAQVHSGCRVIINDRFDIALACGAAGVHLGEHDLPVEAVRGKCPRAFIIGATVRDPAAAAAAETHGADYLGAGAVFPTGLKSDTRLIGPEGLAEIARAVRIPVYTENPKTKRIEFRPPDNSCNPYLAFAAMLMAGIDGIKNKIDPGKPVDKDIYELSPEEASAVPTVPGSLEKSLEALEKDNKFLLEGKVFTKDVIDVWLEYKRVKEIDAVRLRPHPYEFYLYFDI